MLRTSRSRRLKPSQRLIKIEEKDKYSDIFGSPKIKLVSECKPIICFVKFDGYSKDGSYTLYKGVTSYTRDSLRPNGKKQISSKRYTKEAGIAKARELQFNKECHSISIIGLLDTKPL